MFQCKSVPDESSGTDQRQVKTVNDCPVQPIVMQSLTVA